MNVLLICSQNELRSLTGEAAIKDYPGVETPSKGTGADANKPVTKELIGWAAFLATGLLLGASCAAHAGESYTVWRSTNGNRQVEYRWQGHFSVVTAPNCDIQFRNLNNRDRNQYYLTIDYSDPQGHDATYRSHVEFARVGVIQNAHLTGCIAVNAAMIRGRLTPDDKNRIRKPHEEPD